MATLTDVVLRSKKPADSGERLADGGGLFGIVRSDRRGGVAVGFEFRYRSPATGKQRAISCGVWPASSLRAIRLERDNYRSLVAGGADPLEIKRVEKLAASAALAEAELAEQRRLEAVADVGARLKVADVFERWLKVEISTHKDGGAAVRRIFEKDILPALGAMAVEDVKKGHVMAVVDAVKGRNVPNMARRVFSLIRQMMRFAVDRDLIDAEPTAAIRKERVVGKDRERDRVLSASEIRLLAERLPGAVANHIELAVWIMLSTLARVGELSGARWCDVDMDRRQWRVLADASKNGKEHLITLSPFAAEKFKALRELGLSDVWVLPSRDGKGPINSKAVTKQLMDRQRETPLKGRASGARIGALLLPGGQWTSHDLRRTGATLMGDLGVDGGVIEKCLNHIEQNKLKRIYQRSENRAAMDNAWRLLGNRLELLASNGAENVVTFESVRGAA